MIETLTLFGNTVSLYYAFWFLSMLAALIMGYQLRKDFGYSFAQVIIYVVLDLVFAYLLIWVMSWMFGGGKTKGFNFVRIAYIAPLYFVFMAKMFKEPIWKVADFLAPIGGVTVGISHLGCIFSGCCHGYPSQWGIFSNEVQTICFPIQPIEAVTNTIIGIILFVMAKRKVQQGKLYAWFMFLFGSTRFIFEFFRDNQKIWLNISELAMHALVACVLGIVSIVFLKGLRVEKEES